MSRAIAHSVCGKRVVNFTSGQGVVYGVEQYYHAPGKGSTTFGGSPAAISDVTVNGFTDILGTDDYNAKLSTNRANAVKNDIGGHIKGKVKSLTAHGFGKQGPTGPPMYPNTLPEGRYYNRTVQVLVETPINPAQ